MRDDAVGDVDGKAIGRIARASLRHEEEIPGPIVHRAGLCDRYGGDQATRGYCICEKLFHCVFQSVLVSFFPVRSMSDAPSIADHSAASGWCRSGNSRRPQTSTSASASASISASSWYGVGVMRSRSVPQGTVG